MPSPQEQAYSAVERAYGQGDFLQALALAQALQPQLEQSQDALVAQRLQLLIGHIYLYGLAEPQQAELAYRTVLDRCREAGYRQLAEQSLLLCQRPPEPASAPAPAATQTPEAEELPATPWLSQLPNPQAALADIQAAWSRAAAVPEPKARVVAAEPADAATPWTQEQIQTTQPTPSAPAPPPQDHELQAEPLQAEPPATPSAPSGRSELERGLLLVRLSSQRSPSGPHAVAGPLEG